MPVALALRPWQELTRQFGEPRLIAHCRSASTTVPTRQYSAYAFNIAGGKVLRESGLLHQDGVTWRQSIRVVQYIEPVTLDTRFALDFWTGQRGGKWFVADHAVLAVIEGVYEDVVRREAERPSLPALPERVGRGPAVYFGITDVA
ncbi:hypothetical protein ACFCWY_08590 [Streptomyces sp. NPDC056362]|uniref:hypothetical protein n=1 Tax=unclassified Streptomyces TaxID=2593676 RepID=UPI0035DCE76D